jgi:glycosyltransferase involved in cell wall biosynthesis
VIIISNTLLMNGGTTFLIRLCRELKRQSQPATVLILFNQCDPVLLAELEQYAFVVRFWDYTRGIGFLLPSRLRIFGPVNWPALCARLHQATGHIHVLGAFGLVVAYRLKDHLPGSTISTGIYHQNEYLYRSSGSHFEAENLRLFRLLPAENVLFFQESTRQNYEAFHARPYAKSPVVPIGIDLSTDTTRQPPRPFRIVSVGKLLPFKAYNAHMIRIVANLAPRFPDIRYDIYGSGDQSGDEGPNLARLINELGMTDHVHLQGTFPYNQFNEKVADASLFVGSGTALVEAAALGVPAMVGIESIPTPHTYGFLSDVVGFSYNENIAGVPKVSMEDLTALVLADTLENDAIGEACRRKAQSFTVCKTAEGFFEMSRSAKAVPVGLSATELIQSLMSVVLLYAKHVLGIDRTFGQRRNQSY